MNDRSPRSLDEAALELAALYALSALGADEMEAVERDWRARPEFWAEVGSLRDAAAGLAAAGPRAKPRRDLWPDIRARLAAGAPVTTAPAEAGRAQVWKRWQGQRGARAQMDNWIQTARDGAFEPTDIAGIDVRRLFVDEDADRVTMLVRMAPGTAYPAHRHGGAEECYVLAGDLSIGAEARLCAGDYQRMESGSVHAVQSTQGGCLLLIASSRTDQLLG
jgi:quercetin dioxygenase-like cupin family protein